MRKSAAVTTWSMWKHKVINLQIPQMRNSVCRHQILAKRHLLPRVIKGLLFQSKTALVEKWLSHLHTSGVAWGMGTRRTRRRLYQDTGSVGNFPVRLATIWCFCVPSVPSARENQKMRDECKQVKYQNALMVLKTDQLKYIWLQVLEMLPIKTGSGRFEWRWVGHKKHKIEKKTLWLSHDEAPSKERGYVYFLFRWLI